MKFALLHLVLLATVLSHTAVAQSLTASEGARVVEYFDHSACIELANDDTRVVLCPVAGGRVLEYSWQGENALFLDESERGVSYDGSRGPSSAGRFDIGPEQIIPPHPQLWFGRWDGEIIGPRAARLTSAEDEATGVQLIREFRLADSGSHLSFTQTIKNVSNDVNEWCHWSRTFALGNGICVIPLTPRSRFPNKYVMYENGGLINMHPDDPNIRVRDGFLEIIDVPRNPKLGMDSYAGWFAYLMTNDLMFVKRFPTYPDRVYNEVAGLTISIWYPEDRRVELEPIGPRERLAPGESASFTEDWWLLPYQFPEERVDVDLEAVERLVQRETSAP